MQNRAGFDAVLFRQYVSFVVRVMLEMRKNLFMPKNWRFGGISPQYGEQRDPKMAIRCAEVRHITLTYTLLKIRPRMRAGRDKQRFYMLSNGAVFAPSPV